MAAAFVVGQTASAAGFGSSISVAFPSNNAAGNLLVYGGNGHSVATSFSDSKNGTATEARSQASSGASNFCAIWYFENCAAGANTATRSHAADDASIEIAEYSGITTSGSLDQVQSNETFGTSVTSNATATTTQADELVVGYCGYESAGAPATPTGGMTERTESAGNRPGSLADKTVAATGTQTATFTVVGSGTNWCCIVATFRAISRRWLMGSH